MRAGVIFKIMSEKGLLNNYNPSPVNGLRQPVLLAIFTLGCQLLFPLCYNPLSQSLQRCIPPDSKIATTGYWFESLYLTFHLQSKIYGNTEHMQAEVAKR
jgi:hypothetical protein